MLFDDFLPVPLVSFAEAASDREIIPEGEILDFAGKILYLLF